MKLLNSVLKGRNNIVIDREDDPNSSDISESDRHDKPKPMKRLIHKTRIAQIHRAPPPPPPRILNHNAAKIEHIEIPDSND